MTNPFAFPQDPAFDSIDYTLLENTDNDCLTLGHFNPLSLEAPPLLFHPDQNKNFDMDIDFQQEKNIYHENYDFFPEEVPRGQDAFESQETMHLYDFQDEFPVPKTKITLIIEIDDAVYENFKRKAEKTIEEEDTTSVSTKETLVGAHHNTHTYCFEGFFEGSPQSIENEWNQALYKFTQKRPTDEKNYLSKMSHHIIDSLKANLANNPQPVPAPIVFESIISELLYGKEMLMSKEHQLIKELVNAEITKVTSYRPKEIYGTYEKPKKKKQEKRSILGRKNHSALNHVNENFVSNVFRFAKDNFPEDKNLQKFASERGVSATNFRNLTTAKLDDDIFVRKAKVRLVASGKELVTNVEYWMQGGYFENCEDKEKYIQYKQKALSNLALDRMY